MQLEIERQALLKETDAHSKERRAQIEKELAKLREDSSGRKARWQAEKEAIGKIRKLKEQIEQLKAEEERYERAGELAKVAEIRYGKIAAAERESASRRKSASPPCKKARRMLKEEVDEEDIAKLVSKWTGIPVGRLLEGEAQKLVHMEERLRQRVVGQDDALARVSNAVRRSRAGLSDPKRPIGSFIFLGPTGVGKTELARALAEFLFDDEKLMIRIDMSEYMEKHTRVATRSVRLRATSATKRAASSPSKCGVTRIRSSCSTKSKRPIRTCSTCCCRFWKTGA